MSRNKIDHATSAFNIDLLKTKIIEFFFVVCTLPTHLHPVFQADDLVDYDSEEDSDPDDCPEKCDQGSDCLGGQDCPQWTEFVNWINGFNTDDTVISQLGFDPTSLWVCSECGCIVAKLFLTIFPDGYKWLQAVLDYDLIEGTCSCKKPQVKAIPIMTPPKGTVQPIVVPPMTPRSPPASPESETISSIRRSSKSKEPKARSSKKTPEVPKSTRGVTKSKGTHKKFSLQLAKDGVIVCKKCKKSPTAANKNSCTYCSELHQGLLLPYGRSYHNLQSRNKRDSSSAKIQSNCRTCKKSFLAQGTWQKRCFSCYNK